MGKSKIRGSRFSVDKEKERKILRMNFLGKSV